MASIDSECEDAPVLCCGQPGINAVTEEIASDSDSSANGSSHEVKVYGKRWLILTVYCVTALTQGLLWNNWSPIGAALFITFEWSASFLAICLCLSSMGVFVMAIPLMYIIETKGLRMGMVIGTTMMALGVAGWNISLATAQDWLIAVGTMLCGIVGTIIVSGAPVLSVLWFPASEQTTSTAAATMSNAVGVGVAFIAGPYISGANVTTYQITHRDILPADYVDKLRHGVQNVVYFDTALAFLCFVAVMAFFLDKPPKPPNKSQNKARVDFLPSIKRVLGNGQFWLLNISFNLVNGSYYSWVPLSAVNFTKSLGVDEATTGWIGFTSTMLGCFGSVCVALVMDRFKRKSKIMLICMCICSAVLFGLIACLQEKFIYIPQDYIVDSLYVMCILLSLCVNGSSPLCYELACELTYPAYEGISSTILYICNALCGPLFYGLLLVPLLAEDMRWMTWACMAAAALGVPLLLLMKEEYRRLDEESAEIAEDQDGLVSI